jgi:hypothetical protein
MLIRILMPCSMLMLFEANALQKGKTGPVPNVYFLSDYDCARLPFFFFFFFFFFFSFSSTFCIIELLYEIRRRNL